MGRENWQGGKATEHARHINDARMHTHTNSSPNIYYTCVNKRQGSRQRATVASHASRCPLLGRIKGNFHPSLSAKMREIIHTREKK